MAPKAVYLDEDSPVTQKTLISKKVYERRKKKAESHQPWSSSNKMHYLRLSKGRRKPTGAELTSSLGQAQTLNMPLASS